MESEGHPMEAGWHPKQPNGAKSMSKGIHIAPKGHPKRAKYSKVEPKVDQNHPNGAKRVATATK